MHKLLTVRHPLLLFSELCYCERLLVLCTDSYLHSVSGLICISFNFFLFCLHLFPSSFLSFHLLLFPLLLIFTPFTPCPLFLFTLSPVPLIYQNKSRMHCRGVVKGICHFPTPPCLPAGHSSLLPACQTASQSLF